MRKWREEIFHLFWMHENIVFKNSFFWYFPFFFCFLPSLILCFLSLYPSVSILLGSITQICVQLYASSQPFPAPNFFTEKARRKKRKETKRIERRRRREKGGWGKNGRELSIFSFSGFVQCQSVSLCFLFLLSLLSLSSSFLSPSLFFFHQRSRKKKGQSLTIKTLWEHPFPFAPPFFLSFFLSYPFFISLSLILSFENFSYRKREKERVGGKMTSLTPSSFSLVLIFSLLFTVFVL